MSNGLHGRLAIGDKGALGAPEALFVLCPVDPDRLEDKAAWARLAVRDGLAFLALCSRAGVRCEIMAVNLAVAWWPMKLDHAASMHGAHLLGWLKARAALGFPEPGAVHSTEQDCGPTHLWTFQHAVPSSGACGCWIGRLMGARVVATNARLDKAGRAPKQDYEHYHFKWARWKTHGAFDGVYHYGPHSDPRGESFVAGLLPGLNAGNLKARG